MTGGEPSQARPAEPGAPSGPPIGVFIVVGDQPIFRRGLQSTIADEVDLVSLGEAEGAAEALERIALSRPDVVVLDAASLVSADVTVLESSLQQMSRVRCVRLVSRQVAPDEPDEPGDGASGVSCVVSRAASAAQLVDTIRRVHREPRRGDGLPLRHRAARRGARPVGHDLTPRERHLLALMSEGLSNRDIAARLGLAVPTVKGHVQNILAKLCVDNRTSAVLVALRHQLVERP
ncbi:response regulator transcription factor [Ideonella sp. A 288]|uniref:helix-turn-helix transcriptional regulator n=1 Tax=Ideonella sp. A 288 TaxID=1962181 RepID=UPI001302EB56|nr:response regulator transcription factor [Ideonella sp. A 288]